MPHPLQEELIKRSQGQGNINLFSRPLVKNPDGSSSTIRSMSINEDGQEILIPTVQRYGLGVLSDDDAIKQFHQTGEFLGKFGSPDEATNYADMLHKEAESGLTTPPLSSSRRDVDPEQLRRVLLHLLTR